MTPPAKRHSSDSGDRVETVDVFAMALVTVTIRLLKKAILIHSPTRSCSRFERIEVLENDPIGYAII